MNILKKILIFLVAALVFIVGAGGAYLNSTGMLLGHKVASTQHQQGQNSQMQDQMNKAMQENKGTTDALNGSTSNGTTNGEVYGANGGTATPSQGSGQQGTTGTTQVPAQILPQGPPIKVINPEPYYDRLNKAQEIIDEANKMITVDPFSTTGKDGTMNAPDMSKLHQGIYKMSQGVTAMKETLDSLNGEIKGQTQFGVDPSQQYTYQVIPGTSLAVPYAPNGAPNYVYPQGYGYPLVNGYPQGYGYSQGYGYPQAYGYPNQQGQQSNQGNQGQQLQQQLQQQQTQQQQPQQSMQDMPGMSQTGTGDKSSSSKNILVYVIYAVLVMSIVAVFVSIFGILKGLFNGPKKPENAQGIGGNLNV